MTTQLKFGKGGSALGVQIKPPGSHKPQAQNFSGATPIGAMSVVPASASRRLHRKQAATYLGVSLSWLDKSRLKGDGPVFLQIGGRVIYDTADLDDFLVRHRRHSTSGPP